MYTFRPASCYFWMGGLKLPHLVKEISKKKST